MPKKTKPKVKRKRKVRPQAQRRGVPPHPTIQQQFAPIHNQALKNSQRDNQQAQAKAEAVSPCTNTLEHEVSGNCTRQSLMT